LIIKSIIIELRKFCIT